RSPSRRRRAARRRLTPRRATVDCGARARSYVGQAAGGPGSVQPGGGPATPALEANAARLSEPSTSKRCSSKRLDRHCCVPHVVAAASRNPAWVTIVATDALYVP